MKKGTLLVVLISMGTLLLAQNIEIQGKTKITVMDVATAAAQQIAREPDGTLSQMAASTTYAIGDFVQGGVVFWVSANGKHGKVVSIYDIGPVAWSNITGTAVGAAAQSNINGAGNSVAITMQSGHTNSAARHCVDLAYGGNDDWYLPSKNELNQVYIKKDSINVTAGANGGEVFTSTFYWSSTEGSGSTAWDQNFSNGVPCNFNKSNHSRVRAIRAF